MYLAEFVGIHSAKFTWEQNLQQKFEEKVDLMAVSTVIKLIVLFNLKFVK